jgi:sec-independent protein translocase protein TatB
MPDILFIILLALVIFGPRRLPQLAAHAGKYLAQFRRMKRELTGLLEAEMSKIQIADEGGREVTSVIRDHTDCKPVQQGRGISGLYLIENHSVHNQFTF